MRNRRPAPAAVACLLLAVGCGVLSLEEQVLTTFFRAARIRDTALMARVSDVDFNPRIQGVVERFSVSAVRGVAENGGARVVELDARVRKPDGSIEARRLTATLQRGDDGRWRVAKLSG